MSLIRRNILRAIKNTTEVTAQTDTPNSSTLAFAFTTSDALYLGYRKPFASRYFAMGQVSVASVTLSVKYWDGTAWVSVEDMVDQTWGFTASGFIAWQNPGGWVASAQTPATDVELYWVKITVSGTLTAGTTLQAILNLFCDDALMRAYYPELISDTRWLPSGRTDFLEQYVAAKDLVVRRLNQSGIINDESQVLDVNQVALAAVHATAWIIKNPIATSEEDRQKAQDAEDAMNAELAKVRFDFDLDDSGTITESEKGNGNVFRARGRA